MSEQVKNNPYDLLPSSALKYEVFGDVRVPVITIPETFGSHLQRLRIRGNQRQEDIATDLGVSPSEISRIENNQRPVPTNPDFINNLVTRFKPEELAYLFLPETRKIHTSVANLHIQIDVPASRGDSQDTEDLIALLARRAVRQFLEISDIFDQPEALNSFLKLLQEQKSPT